MHVLNQVKTSYQTAQKPKLSHKNFVLFLNAFTKQPLTGKEQMEPRIFGRFYPIGCKGKEIYSCIV